MLKEFFTNIKNIRNAIDTNKLVVFAGAGISIDAGIPGWVVLIDEMKSEIEIAYEEQDDLRIAQMYWNNREQKEYMDKVRLVLKHKKIKYNEIHAEILHLTPEHVLTTNYDDLLEQVIRKRSLPFSVVSKDKEFPYALNTQLLVKVHGDLSSTEIVLKEDDYIDYSLKHPLIEAFLKSVFASKVVLFVGYAFSDINLKMIIQAVRNILGNDFQNAYLLSVDKKLHPAQREYLKRKGINTVNYFDALDSTGENHITNYLHGSNALNEIYFEKGANLSETGQNLLNFLKFISSYDKFNEPLTQKNLIDQIHLSLGRFSEFKSLPPDFVANLFPFNISKRYVQNYKSYSLITKNHNLSDLFFDQIEYVNDEVKFKPPPEMNLTLEQIEGFEDKLKDIIKTLNFSLIFYLFKETEKPDSLGNYGWSDKYKKLQVKLPTRCNCLNCRLNRFEFSSVIGEALNSTVDETAGVQYDLELAYANYKIGNFHKSFQLFEEVANKAWQAGKYFSYYIAKHNVKTLRNLIERFERTLQEDERKKIIQELDDIDFDKLLSQIPFMGAKEYELLKTIRDDDVLRRAEKQIDTLYQQVLDAYDAYKTERRWIWGIDYPQAVEIELYKIVSFYTNNYIVSDEFSDFTRVCKKGIEALLISFATSKDYDQKLKVFSKLFFDVAVLYGDSKEIKEISEKFEINEIVFNEKSLSDILGSVNNFLKSFFTVSTILGRTTFSNKITTTQINNDFFEEKCRKKFSNIFLLLSGVELTHEIAGDLISNLIDFVAHENFLSRIAVESLSSFILKNYKLFSKEDLEKLLKSILHKLDVYENGAFIRAIAYAFKKNNFQAISDQDIIFKILSLTKASDRQANTIVYLWDISDGSIKDLLKKRITNILNKQFNSDLYIIAVDKKIIDLNEYFEQYLAEVNRMKGSGNYTLSGRRPKLSSFTFINAMIFIYHTQIKSDDKRLSIFTDLAEYERFYLNPEEFDYTNFKVEWLYIIDDREVFYKRFAKIPALKTHFEEALKEKFDAELAEMYSKYFM